MKYFEYGETEINYLCKKDKKLKSAIERIDNRHTYKDKRNWRMDSGNAAHTH